MDAVSNSGSVQVAVQAVKQAIDQERNVAALIQAASSPPSPKTALEISAPAPDGGRGQTVDILV
ncbi:MAG: hypothetical protein RIC16_06395 [Rhodospirillales bacterium]